MSSLRWSCCLGIALLSVLSATSPAVADEQVDDITADVDDDEECATYVNPDDRDDAEALGLKGVACFQATEYDWALTHYRRAYVLSSRSDLLAAIGRSLHELGLYEPAAAYYERFLEEAQAEPIRRRLDEVQATIEEHATTVTLRATPPGTTAFVVLDNGEWYELGDTPMQLQVREGDYEFGFDAPGYRPQTVRVDATDGEPTSADTELIEDPLDRAQRQRRTAGLWTVGGSLIVGAAGGALLAMSAQETSQAKMLEDDDFEDLGDYDERRRAHLDAAATTGRWGVITAAVGATGLLVGSALILSTLGDPNGPADADETSSTHQLQPTFGTNRIGVRFQF